MTFGEAIQLVKQGKLATRVGWGSQFIFQRPADALPVDMVTEKVKSLPDSVKAYYREWSGGETHYAGGKPIMVIFSGYLCMKTTNGIIENGWTPSQSDILGEDWVEFKTGLQGE